MGGRLCNEDNLGSVSQLWLVDVDDVVAMRRLDWAGVWLKLMRIRPGARLWSIPVHDFGSCLWNETRADGNDGYGVNVSINFSLPKQKADRLLFLRTQTHKRWLAVGQDYNGQIFVSDPSGQGLRMATGWGSGGRPADTGGVAFGLTGGQTRFSWLSDSWEAVLDGLSQVPMDALPVVPTGAYAHFNLRTIVLTNAGANDWRWVEDVLNDSETVFVNGVSQRKGLDYVIDFVAKRLIFLTDDAWDTGVVWMKAGVRN